MVTKVFKDRQRLGSDSANAKILLGSLNHLRATDRIKLFAFCLMPDHLHVAFCLLPGEELSEVVRSFSKFTALQINRHRSKSGSVWQEGFHDRHCRDRDELVSLCEYIEHNPVRAGLADVASDWEFSSASLLGNGMLDREWWP
ncbi:Transposase IS200 like protein [Planctomycetes bacterium K2D]|uniref:Transposase IS200 like protein n=2 Tax=Botrimarina mediterranea TaxID=2528022 RepID=A0A518K464_9BACT|nr:transposase [Botrimarina mediterranea]QDV72583.1 Transposase IS200 like protein [Botrimarina mediterranea]QDV77155.1 Transposase IS200 like protein [Planctomycetes bacterium K2D]